MSEVGSFPNILDGISDSSRFRSEIWTRLKSEITSANSRYFSRLCQILAASVSKRTTTPCAVLSTTQDGAWAQLVGDTFGRAVSSFREWVGVTWDQNYFSQGE